MLSDRLTALSFIISKLVFTIIIWLLFFNYNIDSIGEDEITVLYNTLNQFNRIQTGENLTHTSAQIIDNNTASLWCTSNIKICNIINNQLWSQEDINKYNTMIIDTIQNIDNILPSSYTKIADTIQSIIIKNENGWKRWYANHYNIVINIDQLSDKEFIEVLTHELGHIVDLWIIQWDSKKLHTAFTEFHKDTFSINDVSLLFYSFSRDSEFERKKNNNKQDFCSTYAMTNPFEDFAECFNLYLNHNSYFNTIKKSSIILEKKYNFLSQLFQNQYITNSYQSLESKVTYRYWDSTRMNTEN